MRGNTSDRMKVRTQLAVQALLLGAILFALPTQSSELHAQSRGEKPASLCQTLIRQAGRGAVPTLRPSTGALLQSFLDGSSLSWRLEEAPLVSQILLSELHFRLERGEFEREELESFLIKLYRVPARHGSLEARNGWDDLVPEILEVLEKREPLVGLRLLIRSAKLRRGLSPSEKLNLPDPEAVLEREVLLSLQLLHRLKDRRLHGNLDEGDRQAILHLLDQFVLELFVYWQADLEVVRSRQIHLSGISTYERLRAFEGGVREVLNELYETLSSSLQEQVSKVPSLWFLEQIDRIRSELENIERRQSRIEGFLRSYSGLSSEEIGKDEAVARDFATEVLELTKMLDDLFASIRSELDALASLELSKIQKVFVEEAYFSAVELIESAESFIDAFKKRETFLSQASLEHLLLYEEKLQSLKRHPEISFWMQYYFVDSEFLLGGDWQDVLRARGLNWSQLPVEWQMAVLREPTHEEGLELLRELLGSTEIQFTYARLDLKLRALDALAMQLGNNFRSYFPDDSLEKSDSALLFDRIQEAEQALQVSAAELFAGMRRWGSLSLGDRFFLIKKWHELRSLDEDFRARILAYLSYSEWGAEAEEDITRLLQEVSQRRLRLTLTEDFRAWVLYLPSEGLADLVDRMEWVDEAERLGLEISDIPFERLEFIASREFDSQAWDRFFGISE